MRAGFEGLRVGFAGFVVPYIFMYRPGLTLQGTWFEIGSAIAITIVVIVAAAAALEGRLRKRLAVWERALTGAAACALLVPSAYLTTLGLAMVSLVLTRQFRFREDEFSALS
jgi:TRAP-type uncharacterized transport system fused permease subunit